MSDEDDFMRRLAEVNPDLLNRKSVFSSRGVHESSEWLRIASLSWRELDLDAIPDLTPLFRAPGGTWGLWPAQSAALLEAEACGGAFISMAVGSGKALTAALMPEALKSKRTVILVPAQLKKRTLEKVYPELAQHFNLPLDRITLVSYTELERASTCDVLERINPDLIVADEAHYLKNKKASRTVRFLRFMKDNPQVRFVCMSGTFTKSSIKDYAHLIDLALKEKSPLPRRFSILEEWADSLDDGKERPAGALLRLCERIEHQHERDHREIFACRLRGSRGVIALIDDFNGPLIINCLPIAVPEVLDQTLKQLRKDWVLGSFEAETSEEINDDLTFARYCRQLACGFYLRWAWPNQVPDKEWLAARSNWNRSVRYVLRYNNRPGLDSYLLVCNAARRGELRRDHQAAWEEWTAVSDRPKPPTETVWISDYVVEYAVKWAKEKPGIVWYDHVPIGEAIAKRLGQRLPGDANEVVMDGRPQVFSVRKFGTGLDGLQHVYSRCLYTSVPNGQFFQQSAGRLHRTHQKRMVEVDMLLPTEETKKAFEAAIQNAKYRQQTGHGKQKLLKGIGNDQGRG
jgi:hypothetical protein